jgi:hypothetical protein
MFLYSSSLPLYSGRLLLTHSFIASLLGICSLMKTQHGHGPTENTSRERYPASPFALWLDLQKTHVTCPLPTVVWRHREHKGNSFSYCCVRVFWALSGNGFTCHIVIEYLLLHNKLDLTWSKELVFSRHPASVWNGFCLDGFCVIPLSSFHAFSYVFLDKALSLVYSFAYMRSIVYKQFLQDQQTTRNKVYIYINYFITLLHISYYEKWNHIFFTAVKPTNYVCSTEK